MIELNEPKCPIGYFKIYPRKIDLIRELQKKLIPIPTSKKQAMHNQKINKEIHDEESNLN